MIHVPMVSDDCSEEVKPLFFLNLKMLLDERTHEEVNTTKYQVQFAQSSERAKWDAGSGKGVIARVEKNKKPWHLES
jgi:hypothetical protein